MSKISIDTKVILNNGIKMPIFGFGTFLISEGRTAVESILHALDAGYRLIDTAQMYGNEESVGRAIKESGIPREDIFITTKLSNSNQGYDAAITALDSSLKKLETPYVDLYLIHWPVEPLRVKSWKALEELFKKGKCLAIGVSNYTIRHLEELFINSSTIPAVNQVEFNPFTYQQELLAFCRSHKIQLESYSPLTKGIKLSDPKLKEIASKYSKTPAQILIRWNLQKEVVVIPKSSKKERIYENADVFDFEISNLDMKTLDSFNQNLRTGWDPSTIP